MEDQNKCAATLEEMLPRLGRKKERTEKGETLVLSYYSVIQYHNDSTVQISDWGLPGL